MAARNDRPLPGNTPMDVCGPETTLDECRCRAAVTRAYTGMMVSGVPNRVALEAATRVYRYHHPEADGPSAQNTVESWVFQGAMH